jgi:hypothetical protein
MKISLSVTQQLAPSHGDMRKPHCRLDRQKRSATLANEYGLLQYQSKQQMQHQLQMIAYAENACVCHSEKKNAYLILAFISSIWLMNSSLKQPSAGVWKFQSLPETLSYWSTTERANTESSSLLTSHCLPCSVETLHQAPKAQPRQCQSYRQHQTHTSVSS